MRSIPSGSKDYQENPHKLQILATSIGSDTLPILHDHNLIKGKVHSVFAKAINILFPNYGLISIVEPRVGRSPSNIVVELGDEFRQREFDLRPGEDAFAMNNRVFVGRKFCVNAEESKVYESNHDFCPKLVQLSQIEENTKCMSKFLRNHGRFDNSGTLAGETSNLIRSFCRSAQLDGIDVLKKTAASMIGFGSGLTPAADDFLCGFMLSCYLFSENLEGNLRRIIRMNRSIVEILDTKTTTLSAQYLKQAAAGNGSEISVSVVEKLLTSQRKGANIEKAVRKLIDVGATSGTYFCFGIIIGAKFALGLITKKKEMINNDIEKNRS